MKIFSHLQTRDQSQKVQNDKLSWGNVETKIFVGGNGTLSHFFEKKKIKNFRWGKWHFFPFFGKKIEKNLEKNFQKNFFFY